MTVVADAGPLIALAKIDGLDVLFRLYPKILIPPAVYTEAVTVGRDRGTRDALALEASCQTGQLKLVEARDVSLPVAAQLGRGEIEAILLAIQERATWVLVDDLAARLAAESSLRSAQVPTNVKGTLGVIVSAFRARHLSADDAIDLVSAIRTRPDIWVHERLCSEVIEALRRQAP